MDSEQHTYLFALEVSAMKAGDIYDTLPLHCTLMHRFHSRLSYHELSKSVQPVLSQAEPIELLPKNHVAFGPKRVLATTLHLTPPLAQLHTQLYDHLNQLGVQYTEKDWVNQGYSPHVTDKNGERLPIDSTFHSKAIYLIEVEYPLHGSRRFVRNCYQLFPAESQQT